jgi:hypothetical protein
MIISEARNLAIKEILPTFKDGYEIGWKLENGKVTVPESFQRTWKIYCEGEWLAMCDNSEVGGQGISKLAEALAMRTRKSFI